ncbi:unnamed protein product [Cladocopium goreaui]|uniref:Hydrolase/peptidase y4tM n=1 Tax=Cladocopium goreaui TaxID=2562237 RepID=A0A9P1CZ18_9DINO|nr:unnamed protein product [Cladocopium goreaui]
MGLAFEEVVSDVLVGQKPDGLPLFHGWDGQPLRVPAEEYKQRVTQTRKSMQQDGIDFLIVVQPEDLYYLTGFYTIGDSAPQALVLPHDGEPFLVARLIECDLVPKLSWVSKVWTCTDKASVSEVFMYAITAANVQDGRVGIQLQSISAAHFFHLQKFLRKFETEIVDGSKTVERVRLVKSDFEKDRIKDASVISEAALQSALDLIKPGVFFSANFRKSYDALISSGSEVPGYLPIVRTTDPSGHGSWMAGEECAPGNLVFLELSGCKFGHHAPLMRTAYILKPEETETPAWLLEAERLIQKTFEVCLPMMVPGAKANDIDAAGREIMMKNSFGLSMAARLAYSTGSTSTQPAGHAGWGDADFSLVGHNHGELKAGMVFHFIPWFQKYNEPSGPIGLSDTVIVTTEGGRRFGELPLTVKSVESVEIS